MMLYTDDIEEFSSVLSDILNDEDAIWQVRKDFKKFESPDMRLKTIIYQIGLLREYLSEGVKDSITAEIQDIRTQISDLICKRIDVNNQEEEEKCTLIADIVWDFTFLQLAVLIKDFDENYELTDMTEISTEMSHLYDMLEDLFAVITPLFSKIREEAVWPFICYMCSGTCHDVENFDTLLYRHANEWYNMIDENPASSAIGRDFYRLLLITYDKDNKQLINSTMDMPVWKQISYLYKQYDAADDLALSDRFECWLKAHEEMIRTFGRFDPLPQSLYILNEFLDMAQNHHVMTAKSGYGLEWSDCGAIVGVADYLTETISLFNDLQSYRDNVKKRLAVKTLEDSLLQKETRSNEVKKTTQDAEKSASNIVTKPATHNKPKTKKEETNMFDNLFQGIFGKVEQGAFRFAMNGQVAVLCDDGSYKTYDIDNDCLTNVQNFTFGNTDEMFFVVPTNRVKKGDVILVSGSPRAVIDVSKNRITVINFNTGTEESILPERILFMGKTYFYGKVVSLLGKMLKKGNSGNGMMKMLMMQQMFGGGNTSNGDGTGLFNMQDGGNSLMQMMMFNNLFSADTDNMFDGLFDGDIFGLDEDNVQAKAPASELSDNYTL